MQVIDKFIVWSCFSLCPRLTLSVTIQMIALESSLPLLLWIEPSVAKSRYITNSQRKIALQLKQDYVIKFAFLSNGRMAVSANSLSMVAAQKSN